MCKKGFVLAETLSFIALIVLATSLLGYVYLMIVQAKFNSTGFDAIHTTKPILLAQEEFLPGYRLVIYGQNEKITSKQILSFSVIHDFY